MGSYGSLIFSPLIPLPALIFLGVVCVALTIAGFFVRLRGGIIRLIVSAILLAWLSGPRLLKEQHHGLPQTALVLVDDSPSMSLRSRSEIARAAATALGTHPDNLLLRVVPVRSSHGHGTRLMEALDQAGADIPPGQFAGAVMITDGQVADAVTRLPERLQPHDKDGHRTVLPLHVLLTAKGEETDRRLRILQAPPYTVTGHPAALRVQVDDSGPGTAAGTPLTLTVREDGGEPVEIPVKTGAPQDISLPVTHPGETLISLSAQPLPGEVSTINNQDVVSVTGVRDRLKVLLVSGAPNQGERVWRRLLKADPSVDLVHFTILRPPGKDDGTPLSELALIPFPVRELFHDKIRQFDLIILDGFENDHILPTLYMQNIARYVQEGGGLFLIAGPEFTGPGSLQDSPVGDVLPARVAPGNDSIVIRRFRPELTPEGRRHPVTSGLSGAPAGGGTARGGEWGPWYRYLHTESSEGDVLMNAADNSPLLLLNHVRQGRVALLLSDQIWLWSRGEDGGGPQAELLRRISHWLMKEPDLEENRLEARFVQDDLRITLHSARDTLPSAVVVTAPDGKETRLPLAAPSTGSASVHMAATEPGIWVVSDGVHRVFAAPGQNDPAEFGELQATAAKLRPVVQASGGSITWLGDNPASISVPAMAVVSPGQSLSSAGRSAFPERGAHITTGSSSTPLLPSWLILLLVLILLPVAWWREERF
ncbi:VWA domain-containing protein [Acetobacter sp. AN02]|uniref:VWA domain-containing protein n=1 Tax=Acetobacter sp. AN02 TaxID=2894186 RepID=UPI00243431CB|nr:VWA domain-containing protein [Acetobacter sp. AN02]MDG6094427.1 VWA domain-containing protein [Acetobacter sp. AN02]